MRRFGLLLLLVLSMVSFPVMGQDPEGRPGSSLTPYMSVTNFEKDLNLGAAPGAALSWQYYFNKEWALKSSVAAYFSQSESLRGLNETIIDTEFGVSRYSSSHFEGFQYLLEGGLIVNLSDHRRSVLPFMGVGTRYIINPTLAGVLGLRFGTDVTLWAGLEVPLLFDPVQIINVGGGQEDVAIIEVEPSDDADGFFEVPRVLYNFMMERPYIKDTSEHWAKLDIDRVTKLGIMNVDEGVFDPYGTVSERDVPKMVLLASYMNKLLEKEIARIEYTVQGEPGVPYTVDMYVLNSEGFVVRNLLSQVDHYAGEYRIEWDGADDLAAKVAAGEYKMHFVVHDGERETFHYVADINVYAFFEASYDLATQTLDFDNVIEVDWGQRVLEAGVRLNLLEDGARGVEPFGQNRPIPKVEFIIAVSKGLEILGAEAELPADLTYYKDFTDIPSYAISYLDRYVDALGYGGVRYESTLDPNKDISRAEAAVILNRLLNWRLEPEPDVIVID